MNRNIPLPLLIALALSAPLAALAQSDASADTDTAAQTIIALPSEAASATGNAASGNDDEAFRQQAQAERQRIADGRAAAQARYGQDRRDCWQRFLVNACLDQARERRRAVLDVLRQDELALNAQERQRRTAARLAEIARNQAANAEREKDSNRTADAPAASASPAQ